MVSAVGYKDIPWERTKERIEEGKGYLTDEEWNEIRFTIKSMNCVERGKMVRDRAKVYFNEEVFENKKLEQGQSTSHYNNPEYIKKLALEQQEKAIKKQEAMKKYFSYLS